MGRGGINFPSRFYLTFLVDRFGSGWHKQIKAGCKDCANNQTERNF